MFSHADVQAAVQAAKIEHAQLYSLQQETDEESVYISRLEYSFIFVYRRKHGHLIYLQLFINKGHKVCLAWVLSSL